MSENRFTVHTAENGWIVDHNGASVALHETKDAAVRDATERARDEHAEVVVADREGRVQADERFGRREPRDGKG